MSHFSTRVVVIVNRFPNHMTLAEWGTSHMYKGISETSNNNIFSGCFLYFYVEHNILLVQSIILCLKFDF